MKKEPKTNEQTNKTTAETLKRDEENLQNGTQGPALQTKPSRLEALIAGQCTAAHGLADQPLEQCGCTKQGATTE